MNQKGRNGRPSSHVGGGSESSTAKRPIPEGWASLRFSSPFHSDAGWIEFGLLLLHRGSFTSPPVCTMLGN